MNPDLEQLQTYIEYRFSKIDLLIEAMTHPSYKASRGAGIKTYERMEFLGDSILGLVIAEYLFMLSHENEGILAQKLSFFASRDYCFRVGKQIDIGQYLYLSKGEESNGGRSMRANIANAVESLIAAIYLDGGMEVAKNFILRFWQEDMNKKPLTPDPKTTLQEWSQNHLKLLPQYILTQTEGFDHSPTFTTTLVLEGLPSVNASGGTKKESEKKAAQQMLEMIAKLQTIKQDS